VSRWLLIVNVLVGALGCLLAAGLIRELGTGRPLPPVPAPLASQNLFNPGRSEVTAVPVAAAGPKPVLHGVMMDGDKSRAYLEEPPTRRVFGYAVGDTIAGGRLDSIRADRVVITRPEGPVEVLLNDPSKPKPVAPAAASPAVQRVPPEPARPPGPGVVPSPTPRQALPR